MAHDERKKQRSREARDEFEERKEVLKDQIRLADKNEFGYDDLIRDIPE